MRKCRPSSFALSAGLMLTFALALVPAPTMAQDATRPIIGDWSGTLDPGAQAKKRIVVHITAAQDGTLSGTIDYPDQDTSGTQMTAITYKGAALHFECTPNLSVYDGTMDKDNSTITGTMKQGGASLDLVLKRTP
jgi:uncharacterized protein